MSDAFIGRHENKIDAKARMSIPSDFRKVLEAGDPKRAAGTPPRLHLIIGDGDRPYVEGSTMRRLAKFERQIKKFGPADPRRLDLEDLLFEHAMVVTLDETGRIVVPPRVRDALGLADKALIVGRNETFRIWKPEAHQTQTRTRVADASIGYDPDKDPMSYLSGDDDDDDLDEV